MGSAPTEWLPWTAAPHSHARLHDYVYFENSSSNPYLIRRIEELNKTANGNVEAKVVCFYRRRDISSSLIALADKHATLSVCCKTGPGADNGEEGETEEEMENPEMVDLPEKLRHQLRHRELFLSRQLESLPATHIRSAPIRSPPPGHPIRDFFFYSLVYDPQQKTLLADKGEIRVGSRYQADITDLLKEGEEDGRDQTALETKVWEAHNPLVDKQIDQFLVVARSVGTFARALDCSSSVRQPSLHMSAAAASRDITLFHAMDTLHRSVYDVARAISALVPQGGPVLCRDEMEEWSASEASLFEEALEKYGKDFTDIQQDFLPWKSLTSIIEYYYMWKTTDRYVQQKRLKAAEAESKLKFPSRLLCVALDPPSASTGHSPAPAALHHPRLSTALAALLCSCLGHTGQEAEKVSSLGKDWHKFCLKCERCSKTLTPGGHAEHDGKPFCHKPCYATLFGPKGVNIGGAGSYIYEKPAAEGPQVTGPIETPVVRAEERKASGPPKGPSKGPLPT
ncbi:PREDICTED: metastasis-associated protein MTA1 [Condylura cristata]|uniref:metastasis-associated protein MTA1 n=1 Tax=Condylura cristata TaxID=143302 RepID=UPI0006433B66|nr:PREDICTED: metastasis-associated protein MTA1 [Condylura cristata]